jgi:hypothetical protein
MGGSIPIATQSTTDSAGAMCSIVVADNNGQTQSVTLIADPALTTPTGTGASNTFTITCTPLPPTYHSYDCLSSTASFGLGFGTAPNGTQVGFTTTTNAIAISYNDSTTSNISGTSITSIGAIIGIYLQQGATCWGIASATSGGTPTATAAGNKVLTLPNGAGTYSIGVYGSGTATGNYLVSNGGLIGWDQSVTQAPNGSGTVTPTSVTCP